MIKYRDLFIKHNNKEMIRYRERKYARGSEKIWNEDVMQQNKLKAISLQRKCFRGRR
jgi:hypothetical protein